MKHQEKNNLKHLFSSIRYSFDGLKTLFQEIAFRQEIIFYLVLNILFLVFSVPAYHYIILLFLFLLLVATEALNTAIEYIVDRISPEISDFGKKTKDLGSAAVFCILALKFIYVLSVLLNIL